jgi:hypothetical protein
VKKVVDKRIRAAMNPKDPDAFSTPAVRVSGYVLKKPSKYMGDEKKAKRGKKSKKSRKKEDEEKKSSAPSMMIQIQAFDPNAALTAAEVQERTRVAIGNLRRLKNGAMDALEVSEDNYRGIITEHSRGPFMSTKVSEARQVIKVHTRNGEGKDVVRDGTLEDLPENAFLTFVVSFGRVYETPSQSVAGAIITSTPPYANEIHVYQHMSSNVVLGSSLPSDCDLSRSTVSTTPDGKSLLPPDNEWFGHSVRNITFSLAGKLMYKPKAYEDADGKRGDDSSSDDEDGEDDEKRPPIFNGVVMVDSVTGNQLGTIAEGLFNSTLAVVTQKTVTKDNFRSFYSLNNEGAHRVNVKFPHDVSIKDTRADGSPRVTSRDDLNADMFVNIQVNVSKFNMFKLEKTQEFVWTYFLYVNSVTLVDPSSELMDGIATSATTTSILDGRKIRSPTMGGGGGGGGGGGVNPTPVKRERDGGNIASGAKKPRINDGHSPEEKNGDDGLPSGQPDAPEDAMEGVATMQTATVRMVDDGSDSEGDDIRDLLD